LFPCSIVPLFSCSLVPLFPDLLSEQPERKSINHIPFQSTRSSEQSQQRSEYAVRTNPSILSKDCLAAVNRQ
jgi:hypothetical protein